jgi:4-hydroxy-4-methyl-2-oxoglutarate aldolase
MSCVSALGFTPARPASKGAATDFFIILLRLFSACAATLSAVGSLHACELPTSATGPELSTGRVLMAQPLLSKEAFDALRRLDTCAVEDAIEAFDLRARNTGFTDSSIRCMFEDFPPMLGYAATARLRSGDRPMSGRSYHDRTEWWNSILKVPAPRIVVLEDVDDPPGIGAFLGDVHAAMLKALGCVGYVTNGAVREVPAVGQMDFHLFARNVGVSHAYARIIDHGCPVLVGGMVVRPGELLHGDRHGVVSVPRQIAGEIPAVAAKLADRDRRVLAVCSAPDFSVENLRKTMQELE